MHWEARSIELQDIDLPRGHVLVGLVFENVTVDGGTRVILKPIGKRVNYDEGKVVGRYVIPKNPEFSR